MQNPSAVQGCDATVQPRAALAQVCAVVAALRMNLGQRQWPQAAQPALRGQTGGKKCHFLFKILFSLGPF